MRVEVQKKNQRCDKSHICPDHPRSATPTKVVRTRTWSWRTRTWIGNLEPHSIRTCHKLITIILLASVTASAMSHSCWSQVSEFVNVRGQLLVWSEHVHSSFTVSHHSCVDPRNTCKPLMAKVCKVLKKSRVFCSSRTRTRTTTEGPRTGTFDLRTRKRSWKLVFTALQNADAV